jgi:elongation factor P
MINANQIKSGMVIKVDREFYQVLSYQHVKPGKGPAYMRTKLKRLNDQITKEKTFRSEEKLEPVFLTQKKLIFLYHNDDTYFFMDADSYEQISTTRDKVKNLKDLMKEGQEVSVLMCEGQIVSVNLPNLVSLKVISTEAGIKGNTVKATYKNACLETGAQISVPLFIQEGDVIKVDTRTKGYIGRVK